MMIWTFHDSRMTMEHLGFLPDFLHEADPRPAREQFDENYVFGGWRPMKGWVLHNPPAPEPPSLKYPGDPSMRALATTQLRDERIAFFSGAWVAIIQPDGGFEVARLD